MSEDPAIAKVHDVAATLIKVILEVASSDGFKRGPLPEGGFGIDLIIRQNGGNVIVKFSGTDEVKDPDRSIDYCGQIEYDKSDGSWSGYWHYNGEARDSKPPWCAYYQLHDDNRISVVFTAPEGREVPPFIGTYTAEAWKDHQCQDYVMQRVIGYAKLFEDDPRAIVWDDAEQYWQADNE